MPAVKRALSRLGDAFGLASFGAGFGDRLSLFCYAATLPLALKLPRALRDRIRYRFDVTLDGRSRAALELYASHEEYLTFREVFLEEEYGGARADGAKVIVDLGANIGLASVYLALRYPDARVYAVEANAALQPRLEGHLAGFGPDRARAERLAIAAEDGEIEFGVSDEKPIASSAARSGDGFRVERVPALSWESFLARRNLARVDLLKCDAEGAEHAVLTSPAFGKVGAFVGEIHDDLMPEPWAALRDRLAPRSHVVEERAGKAGRAIARIYPPRPALPAAPSVAIVIAAYNRERTVGESVRSALAQGSRVREVIVVDDGSSDATADAARAAGEGDPRLAVVTLGRNGGASAARNEGVRRASADLVLVWDSDDALDLGSVDALLAEFEKDPALGVVAAVARFASDGKTETPSIPAGELTHADFLCRRVNALEKVRLARRDLLAESPYLAANVDFLVNVELSERGRWRRVPTALGTVNDSTASGSLTASRRVPSVAKAAARAPHLAAFLARDGAAMRRACPGAFAAYAYGGALANLLAGNRRQALRLAARGFSAEPSATLAALAALALLPGGSAIARLAVGRSAASRARVAAV
jgi:FkbM family methyltransferase